MKRLGFNSIVAIICFVIGLLAFSLGGFVRLRSKIDVPLVKVPQIITPAPQLPVAQMASPESRIRRVDFMNFTYPNKSRYYHKVASEIRLTNGDFEFYNPKDHFIWLVGGETDKIIYADLTGDDEEEAVIDLFSHSGASGGERFIYVYTMAGKYPKLLWFFETYASGSDIGGIREMYVQDGVLVLELNGRNRIKENGSTLVDEYQCDQCYKEFTRMRFQWDGKRFKQKGRLEVYPLPDGQN